MQAIGITSPEVEIDNQKLGQLYIIGANAEQEFIGHESNIAQKLEHGWRFIIPYKWLEVVLDDDGSHYRFDGENGKSHNSHYFYIKLIYHPIILRS